MNKKNMLKEYNLDRLNHKGMKFYLSKYEKSSRWNGSDSLEDKEILVMMEGGLGDQIQCMRYLPQLKKMAKKVIAHCSLTLVRLVESLGVEAFVLEEDTELPDHDLHTLSLSLPFLLEDPGNDAYFQIDPLPEVLEVEGLKVGLAWEGNPGFEKNLERSCPLKYFKILRDKYKDAKFFMLQIQQNLPELAADCEDFDLYAIDNMSDMYQTSRLISSMDLVFSVDTSVLHLSAAHGVKTIGLLAFDHDKRWLARKWYNSLSLWRQTQPADWQSLFETLPYHEFLT